jgi:hypothetical protein
MSDDNEEYERSRDEANRLADMSGTSIGTRSSV